PHTQDSIGLPHRAVVEPLRTRFAILGQSGTLNGNGVNLLQIRGRMTACNVMLVPVFGSCRTIPEKPCSPDQEPVNFGIRDIAITMLRGVIEPTFSRTFVLGEIDGQPSCEP